jgi:hypothetical protein
MPAITSLGHVIYDASGNPLSGGKLRVYTANTTTLVSLYSDEALSVPLSNPVVANSEGRPASGSNECVVYAASGTYDVAELTAADAVLRNWDDFVPSGESGDFSRTVTGNGRVSITGSAGAVLFRAGDPSPDNSGGTLTIEGWAGTALDTLTLDATAVNAGSSSGALKENSKKLFGVVQTEATTFTTAATVDIELPNLPTGVRKYEIEFFDLTNSASMQPRGRLSFDSGGTYKSGAADYTFSGMYYDVATNVYALTSSAGATSFELGGGLVEPLANKLGRILVTIITPTSGSDAVVLDAITNTWNSDSFVSRNWTAGMCQGASYGRATHFRLIPSAGTVTGKYVVRVFRGFGET